MTIKCVYFLLVALHVGIFISCVKLITQESFIILLYSSNIILIITALKREWFPLEEKSLKEEVLGISLAKTQTDALSTKDRLPNLYIQRWKTKYLDRPIEYPLDRFAFLTAKYSPCMMDSCIQLKNSQLKQLVKKLNTAGCKQVPDELHPCKMVNDCFDIYLHKRSSFYTKRNVINKGQYQLTRPGKKMQFREIDGQELIIFQNYSPYSSVIDLVNRGHPCYDYPPTSEEDDDDKVTMKTWKRIRRAFSR